VKKVIINLDVLRSPGSKVKEEGSYTYSLYLEEGISSLVEMYSVPSKAQLASESSYKEYPRILPVF
jgi:hypothetical protein